MQIDRQIELLFYPCQWLCTQPQEALHSQFLDQGKTEIPFEECYIFLWTYVEAPPPPPRYSVSPRIYFNPHSTKDFLKFCNNQFVFAVYEIFAGIHMYIHLDKERYLTLVYRILLFLYIDIILRFQNLKNYFSLQDIAVSIY